MFTSNASSCGLCKNQSLGVLRGETKKDQKVSDGKPSEKGVGILLVYIRGLLRSLDINYTCRQKKDCRK
jgi:hypothetical protein